MVNMWQLGEQMELYNYGTWKIKDNSGVKEIMSLKQSLLLLLTVINCWHQDVFNVFQCLTYCWELLRVFMKKKVNFIITLNLVKMKAFYGKKIKSKKKK